MMTAYSNRVALAAANLSDQAAILAELGRERLFVWDSSDLSTNVTTLSKALSYPLRPILLEHRGHGSASPITSRRRCSTAIFRPLRIMPHSLDLL